MAPVAACLFPKGNNLFKALWLVCLATRKVLYKPRDYYYLLRLTSLRDVDGLAEIADMVHVFHILSYIRGRGIERLCGTTCCPIPTFVTLQCIACAMEKQM